jgi:hypothetical protein
MYRRSDGNTEYQIRYGAMVLAVMLKGMAKMFCTLCKRSAHPPQAPTPQQPSEAAPAAPAPAPAKKVAKKAAPKKAKKAKTKK